MSELKIVAYLDGEEIASKTYEGRAVIPVSDFHQAAHLAHAVGSADMIEDLREEGGVRDNAIEDMCGRLSLMIMLVLASKEPWEFLD